MALSGVGVDISGIVGAAAIGSQYLAVQLDGNGKYIVPASEGGHVDGFVQTARTSTDPIDIGDPITVRISGITKAVSAGSVTRGDLLMADTSGKVKTAAATTSARYICGKALQTGSSDGDIIRIQILDNYIAATS